MYFLSKGDEHFKKGEMIQFAEKRQMIKKKIVDPFMILETDILSCNGGLSQFTMEGINENLGRWENIGHKYILFWEVGQWKEWKRMEALAQFRENFQGEEVCTHLCTEEERSKRRRMRSFREQMKGSVQPQLWSKVAGCALKVPTYAQEQ